MRWSLTARDGRDGRRVDVLVDALPGQLVADLLPPLLACLDGGGAPMHPSFAGRVATWVDGRAVDPGQTLLQARVGPGSVVTVHAAAEDRTLLRAGVGELRVVGGPGAGRVHRLNLGDTEVGNGTPGLSLPDLLVPSRALRVRALPDGAVTVRAFADVTATLDGEELVPGEDVPWPEGGLLVVGGTALERTAVFTADADASASTVRPGTDVNRPPRLLPPPRTTSFTLPREPVEPIRRPVPWLVVLAPLLMVIPLYLVFQSPRVLIFAVMAPVLALVNWLSDKVGSRKKYLADVARHGRESAEVEERVAAALAGEEHDRRLVAPDPALVLLTALGPGRRLWERRRSDPDRLHLRVGLTSVPADVTVTQPAAVVDHRPPPPPRQVDDVPAVVDLVAAGVVGVHGEHAVATARWLVAQAAVLHSPRDLRVVCLTDRDGQDRFGFVRWLPHAGVDDVPVTALVGVEQVSVARRLAELSALVTERLASSGAGTRGWTPPGPDVLLVLDGARRLRSLPAVVQLLRDGPAAGVVVLCLDAEQALLPEECRAVVRAEDDMTVRLTLTADVTDVRPDLVDALWADRVARALAPLRDTTPEAQDAGGLPASARLLDVVGLDPPHPEGVLERWRRDGRTTEAVLGVGFDGPFRVDLRRDGPHALVAGTTGSGKSELLQTLVASLAVVNRPDALTFVLVDYKGGSAFKDCARLPHTVGMVTDLDEHLVSRALTSLSAELKRREHLLAGPGAKDLEDYWALQRTEEDLPAIPRLVIVIDEFASLVAELPDFVTGLVSIAQRGRSLGIHLVLATQRPTGVVSADIRANTTLRICLRVTDEAESRDVVDAPDAAHIGRDLPGRAYVRTGAATLLPFQAGRVGGRRPDTDAVPVAAPAPMVWPVPWAQAGLPAPQRPAAATGPTTDEGGTDLAALVEAVREAATQARVPVQPSPWLPALPDVVPATDLPAAGPGEVVWGLQDVPADQARRPLVLAPGTGGHLYVVGGPGSGRSTALRTIAARAAATHPVADLHVHVLDCGGGALLPVADLPHAGAVVQRTETERADRLLRRLVEEVASRQALLAAGGFASLADQRDAAPVEDRLPYLLLLLDRWEGFLPTLGELDGGRPTEDVQLLLREGASVGVQLVLSGDRSLLSGRMSALVEHKLLLHLPDASDVTLAGLSVRQVPRGMPPGRGVWVSDVLQAQVAVLGSDPGGAAQTLALRELAAGLPPRESVPAALRPFRLTPVPATIDADNALTRPRQGLGTGHVTGLGTGTSAGPVTGTGLALPVGVGGDDGALLGLDLASTPVAVVSGPPRSGRTSTLRWLLRVAREGGVPALLVVAPRPDSELALEAGEAYLDPALGLDPVVARIRALPAGALVLVDDAEVFREGEVAPALLAVVKQAREKRWGVVLAGLASDLGTGFGGWVSEARKSRQGLLLSPQTLPDGDVVGARLTRSMLTARVLPGRGLLVRPGEPPTPVQVPLVR